jgi:hypothetical protein
MAGHSRPKDGVASARLCPGHPRLVTSKKDVDARDICAKTRFALLPGHDEDKTTVPHGVIETGEKSTNQLLGCTKPLTFELIARGPTSWAT